MQEKVLGIEVLHKLYKDNCHSGGAWTAHL